VKKDPAVAEVLVEIGDVRESVVNGGFNTISDIFIKIRTVK